MTTLTIKDLAIASDLGRAEMASVSGGCYKVPASCWTPSYCPSGYGAPGYEAPKPYGGSPTSFSFDASQSIGQSQNVVNNNGNNAAFVNGITSTVNPTQTANNSINL